MNMRLLPVLAFALLVAGACGPKAEVRILKTTVRPSAPASPAATGPERFFPADAPEPFKLGGGPVTYRGEELAAYLRDKRAIAVIEPNGEAGENGEPRYQIKDPSGWSEKVEVMVTAEYIDPIERPIAVEVYELADPMLADLFAKAYFKEQKDRSHQVADRYLVHVLWFAPDDADLRDVGLDLQDAITQAISEEKPTPTPTPTPTSAPTGTPQPTPASSPTSQP